MKRDFKGIWIPKDLWLDKNLTIMEKVFLVEIDSLDNEDGCYASNKYFSEFFSITKGRCTQIIKSLESKEYITIEILKEEKAIIKRLIKVVNKLNRVVNLLNEGSEYIKQGYLENDDDNNTYNNNTKNKRDLFISSVLSNSNYIPSIHLDPDDPAGFISYWTERGIEEKKMRYEKEKSFDIFRRLATWKKNQKEWQKDKPNQNPINKFKRNALTYE